MPNFKDTQAGSRELTLRYREGGKLITDSRHREAYLAVRMPATYAAVSKALSYLPEITPQTMKDLGAGPGTASFAALKKFPTLSQFTLYEQDKELALLGKQLMRETALREAEWIFGDLVTASSFQETDLTILSYVTNEMEHPEELIKKAWASTKQLLLIVEPGTPRGFEKIRLIRDLLIHEGAEIAAPCPHANRCPLAGGDWCHFAARFERTREHQQVKEASRGFEDEKFSYVAFTRSKFPLPNARILRHPEIHSGHLQLTLCTPSGIKQETFSKKQGPLYKRARKSSWGDTL